MEGEWGGGRAPLLSFMQRGGVRDPDAQAAPAHLAEDAASESPVRRRDAPLAQPSPAPPAGEVPQAELLRIDSLAKSV